MGTTEGPVIKGAVHHAVGVHDDARLLQWLLHGLRHHQALLLLQLMPLPLLELVLLVVVVATGRDLLRFKVAQQVGL